MDVAGLIASFSSGTFTVTRTARGSVTKGKTAAGTTSSVTITATIWPAKSNDLMRLPENRRTQDTIAVMTTTEILPGGQGASYEADKISYLGESWEASAVDVWTDTLTGGTAYRCLFTVIR